jgi:hypothetical protein
MKKEEFCVIVFESTHDAIRTEKAIKKVLDIELIPTPREITASCGLSVKFYVQDLDTIKEIVRALGTEQKRLFAFKTEGETRGVSEMSWEV